MPFQGRPQATLNFLSSSAALQMRTHLHKVISILNIFHPAEMKCGNSE
jgi:hypothetical protein